MNKGKIKNYILILMVIICILLSTQVWFQVPNNYFGFVKDNNNENTKVQKEINLWSIVCPEKYILDSGEEYTVLYNDNKNNFWDKTLQILSTCFNDKTLQITDIYSRDIVPNKYIKIDFSSEIPVEIFLQKMNIDNSLLQKRIGNIKNITISLSEGSSIYIYNGEKTLKLSCGSMDLTPIQQDISDFDFNNYTKYKYNETIDGYEVMVPIPDIESVLNPIYVKSEIDISDYEYINKIARDYFKEDYDYVRKREESTGNIVNIVYVYNNEKVLKIVQNGLLDFYDAVEESANENGVYTSLVKALEFIDNFLGFPENGYLSRVDTIQEEGKFGYKFIFSYKVKDKPIVFSQIRAEQALEVEVFGNKVVSYKRYIRNIDELKEDKMKEEKNVISATEVDFDFIVGLYIKENNIIEPDYETIKKELVQSIQDIHLAYFDLSRKSKEQQLLIVWVVETDTKKYIFNAITGKIIEEQNK